MFLSQRAAVLGYPNWGSDTCGYNRQLMEQEVCARWLEFSAFTPIMEVGPTRNVGFWNLPRDPSYDQELIALWRLYGRIHAQLADYSYTQAQDANRTGMPMVRPLFLVDPKSPVAWSDWQTYETPFFLEKGQQPDLIKLNVVMEGKGIVWVKDVEVLKAPLR